MTYQVLARKYRPKNFTTLVGQEHVVRALTHALEQQRLHHAWLFTGTRGVGKTTLSRILAKSLNCEKGITAQPCGQCEACVSIDAGRFVDYIEMDAASNRGVDEMAALLEQAIYAPSNARFKVYMIDEVHMLTNHAFNAMLKTLEEPPAHVKFILATTDPQKIPVTVLSRCLQFNLKQMPPGHIVSHLENILGQEQIEFEVPALRLLAQGAQGSMRDALSLTDQAIAYAAGKVSLEAVQGMLGALDQSYLIKILEALSRSDVTELLSIAEDMSERSLSYKNAMQDLASQLHLIALAQIAPSALAENVPEREMILNLAQAFSKEQVQLYYQILVHGRNELGLAPDEFAGFSMTLLRMLAFKPQFFANSSAPGQSGSSGLNGAQARQDMKSALQMTRAEAVSSIPVSSEARSKQLSAGDNPPPTSDSANASRAPVTTPVKPSSIGTTATPVASTAQVSSSAVPSASQGGSKVSPAMAALAAARAASQKIKEGQGSRALLSADDAPKASPSRSEPIAQQKPTPAHSFADVSEVSQRDQSNPPPSTPSVGKIAAGTQADDPMQNFAEPMGMNDLPPPWDDYVEPVEGKVVENKPELLTPHVTPAETTSNWNAALNKQRSQELGIDWPDMAGRLNVRAIAGQLALQSELVAVRNENGFTVLSLKVPLQTLLSSGSLEKLEGVISTELNTKIKIETSIAPVELTAHAKQQAQREERQRQAEASIMGDNFIQTLMREFSASLIPGSVKPI